MRPITDNPYCHTYEISISGRMLFTDVRRRGSYRRLAPMIDLSAPRRGTYRVRRKPMVEPAPRRVKNRKLTK